MSIDRNTPPSGFFAGFFWRLGNLFGGNKKSTRWTDSTAPVILKGDKPVEDDLMAMNNVSNRPR